MSESTVPFRLIRVPRRGCELHAAVYGEGPAVILLHGGTGTHTHVASFASSLMNRYMVITPDVRGHGRSVCRDPDAYEWEELADDVVALLDYLGLDESAIGGWSMGSVISAVTALRVPSRISSVMLMNCGLTDAEDGHGGGFATEGQTEFELGQELRELFLQGGFDAVFDHVSQRVPQEHQSQAFMWLTGYALHDPQSIDAALSGLLVATIKNPPWQRVENLRAIRQPTLVVAGADPLHPRRIAERYMSVLPNATLATATAADFAALAVELGSFLDAHLLSK